MVFMKPSSYLTESSSQTQETPLLSEEIRTELHEYLKRCSIEHMPRHVAIIPDGNRRWAKQQAKPFFDGYIQGAQTLITTALVARELQIPVLTVFSFSTENWKRPPHERTMLWELFIAHLRSYQPQLLASDIRLSTIGNVQALPQELQKTLDEVQTATQDCRSLNLVLAMNYGGRDEIIRAVQKLLSNQHYIHNPSAIDEVTLSKFLDTKAFCDPDLIIRTGGEQRLSNFLLWQSSYAELYTETSYWPDFTPQTFIKALGVFFSRTRRHGGGDA